MARNRYFLRYKHFYIIIFRQVQTLLFAPHNCYHQILQLLVPHSLSCHKLLCYKQTELFCFSCAKHDKRVVLLRIENPTLFHRNCRTPETPLWCQKFKVLEVLTKPHLALHLSTISASPSFTTSCTTSPAITLGSWLLTKQAFAFWVILLATSVAPISLWLWWLCPYSSHCGLATPKAG